MKIEQLLELRLRTTNDRGDFEVILIEDSYWTFSDFDDLSDEAIDEIKKAIARVDTDYEYEPGKPLNFDSFRDITEYNPSVIYAQKIGDKLHITEMVSNMSHSPMTSKQLRKLAKTLGVSHITNTTLLPSGDEVEIDTDVRYAIGDLPTSLFHGTSVTNLLKILRVGLMPGHSQNNTKYAKLRI